MNRYIFGPIISRRLGVSLGVDLVSHKICTLDCLYCECGKTKTLTLERKEYNKIDDIIKELDNFLINKPIIDYITLTGEGEPTLNIGIKRLIKYIKEKYPDYKVAILTNGTLLYDEEVQNDIMDADLIIPSFDAYSNDVFKNINHPHIELNNEKVIEGLIDFSHKFIGKIWIEIFIAPGINDRIDEILKMKKALEKMKFEKIQLNSLDRCPAYSNVKEATIEELERIADLLSPLNVEIIKKIKLKKGINKIELNEKNLLDILERRPCTIEDFIEIFNSDRDSIKFFLDKLLKEKKILNQQMERGLFYKINNNGG